MIVGIPLLKDILKILYGLIEFELRALLSLFFPPNQVCFANFWT